jgi:hypothetical protein
VAETLREGRFERIEKAVSTMAWRLAQAQTGFGERDARGIEDILRGGRDEDEFWLVKSEGKPDRRSLAYWGPYKTEDEAMSALLADDQTVVVYVPANKKLVHGV